VIKQFVILCSLSVFVACAGPSEPLESTGTVDSDRPRDCIREPSIRGYTVLDEQNLIVETSRTRKYHVVLSQRAHGLRNSPGIVFDSPTSRICSGFSEIVLTDAFGARTGAIRISNIRLLSPEEDEDLLIKFGKKEPEIKITPAPREVEGAEVEELDPDASE
jgi:uncharacterized protein DUF6491